MTIEGKKNTATAYMAHREREKESEKVVGENYHYRDTTKNPIKSKPKLK